METTYFVCRDCESEFEVLILPSIEYSCLSCESENVRERKNAKMNCNICCDGCEHKSGCEAWKD